jgi:1,4-dihydroxy-6-naphthoate synthase
MDTCRIAISPCPNDTFAFGALVNGLLPNTPRKWELLLADIDELNSLAEGDEWPIVKTSYFAYAHLQHRYELLEAGSALGYGVGPLLLSRAPIAYDQLAHCRIAIPGQRTTAHLLLHHYAPHASHKTVMRFDAIMPALARGEVDAGVVIHEGRFTYANYGLHCLADLGQVWEERQQAPIPLGAILMQKSLGHSAAHAFSDWVAQSIRFARQHPEAVMPFVKAHAQELEPHVIQSHIDLYVNDYSLALGPTGHRAVQQFLAVAQTLSPLAP